VFAIFPSIASVILLIAHLIVFLFFDSFETDYCWLSWSLFTTTSFRSFESKAWSFLELTTHCSISVHPVSGLSDLCSWHCLSWRFCVHLLITTRKNYSRQCSQCINNARILVFLSMNLSNRLQCNSQNCLNSSFPIHLASSALLLIKSLFLTALEGFSCHPAFVFKNRLSN